MNQGLHFWRYGLKLRACGPANAGANARSSLRVLEGMLIRTAEGGYGCIHPWPELGDEPLREHWDALHGRRKPTRLVERALACAGLDAAARREGRSLFEGLNIPASHATVIDAVAADFAGLKAEGFTVVKLKGGADWHPLLTGLRRAAEAGLRVRLDFNSVLTEAAFLEFVAATESEGLGGIVEFVEDPVSYVRETWRRLKAVTGWNLALDWIPPDKGTNHGNTTTAAAAETVDWADGGFDFHVIKPAVQASPSPGRGAVVFTSAMDHPVGQLFAAYEAARWNAAAERDNNGAGEPPLAGLLTHRLFEADNFTHRLGDLGPNLRQPGGTGLGFGDLLEALPWQPLVRCGNRGRSGVVFQNPRDPLAGGEPVLNEGEMGFPTSGSTGHPAVIVHTDESLEASAAAVNAWVSADAADVWMRVLPLFHVGGRQIQTRAELAGSRVVAMTDDWKWNAAEFAGECQAEGVTLASLVPAQVFDLVSAGLCAPVTLRIVLVGGGALEIGLWRKARALGWPVIPSYGSTEAGSTIAAARPASAQTLEADGHLSEAAAVGEPGAQEVPALELLPGWEARVAETDFNSEGLLELRGPALARFRMVFESMEVAGKGVGSGSGSSLGLWRRVPLTSSETPDPTEANSWWRTSDRVRLSSRDLSFAGRADRVVKVLGELVNLVSVEQSLAECGLEPGSFVVLPINDERQGNALVMVSEGDIPPASLARYTEKAAPFARIARVVRVEALPRSALGKVRFAEAAKLIPPPSSPQTSAAAPLPEARG